MTLLENEEKLDSLTKSDLLTNYRIMKESGNSYKISIFLEKISSIVVYYETKPLYLLLGIVSIIAGLIMFGVGEELFQRISLFTFVIGVIFIINYFLTKKHVITISPDGGKNLNIEVKGTSKERIEEFITNIQRAKQAKNVN